ncbi:MAG TPA: biotin/lipoyl-containing protein [Chloroflexota bacterium]|nr:biotin/lipoyl-containing protein [Chloroflexota bacterium]
MNGETSYQVTVGEHTFDITLVPTADGLVARVGDETRAVAWHARAPHVGTLTVGDRVCEVLLAEGPETALVAVDGYHAEARVIEARALQLAASLPARAVQAEQIEIRAPMPGRVLSVRVAPGEMVPANALVAILEAMKMENELRAPRLGWVAAVRVAEGDTVEHGALLVLLNTTPPV